jgi:hypothetical protein
VTRELADHRSCGDEVLVWNGALSTVRIRVPCADASAPVTEGQAEAAEPLRSRAALCDAGLSDR